MLWLIVCKFVDDIDLHPDVVSNNEMGYIFEELIRKFSEMSNETAGEHFTPREVIRLMVSILFCLIWQKIKDSVIWQNVMTQRQALGDAFRRYRVCRGTERPCYN